MHAIFALAGKPPPSYRRSLLAIKKILNFFEDAGESLVRTQLMTDRTLGKQHTSSLVVHVCIYFISLYVKHCSHSPGAKPRIVCSMSFGVFDTKVLHSLSKCIICRYDSKFRQGKLSAQRHERLYLPLAGYSGYTAIFWVTRASFDRQRARQKTCGGE